MKCQVLLRWRKACRQARLVETAAHQTGAKRPSRSRSHHDWFVKSARYKVPHMLHISQHVGSPFAISKLGYAVVPAACGVGPFHWRLGGDLSSHGLHQTLQLAS